MAEKKSENKAFARLKEDVAAGRLAKLYVFHGEETYLKEHYIAQIAGLVCPDDLAAFNRTVIDGNRLDLDSLIAAVDSVPWGTERKLVHIVDYPVHKPTAQLKDHLEAILSNLPDYICLIFDYHALEFKPDKRLNAWKTVEKCAQVVEFQQAQSSELISWIRRRFKALGKTISAAACEYLIFYCGALMNNLITEIEKIAAGVDHGEITVQDIEQLGSRVLDADVFMLTDCILNKDYGKGFSILRDLFEQRNEPVMILGAITRQLQRIYGAKLALQAGKGQNEIMELFSFRSAYPARLLAGAAKTLSLTQLRRAQALCLNCDMEIKSNLPDPNRALELLLLRLNDA